MRASIDASEGIGKTPITSMTVDMSQGGQNDVKFHFDRPNLENSLQGVYVWTNNQGFVGGEFVIDGGGRQGHFYKPDNQTERLDPSKKIFVLESKKKTLFLGDYRKWWHRSWPAVQGYRMIFAVYTKQIVADVCTNALRHPGFNHEVVHRLLAERALHNRKMREILGGSKNDNVRVSFKTAAKERWLQADRIRMENGRMANGGVHVRYL